MGIRDSLATFVGSNVSQVGALVDNPLTRSLWEQVTGGDEVDTALDTGQRLADEGFFVAYERALVRDQDQAARAQAWSDLRRLVDLAGAQSSVAEVAVFWDMWTEEEVLTLAQSCAQSRVRLVLGYRHGVDMDRTWALAQRCAELQADVVVTVCAALRRSESDLKSHPTSDVRIIKGASWAAGGETFSSRHEVDKSFVRCAKASLAGHGHLSFATHDSRIIDIVAALIDRYDRSWTTVEFALYQGRRIAEAERLRDAGYAVRIYIPFGPERKERLVTGLLNGPIVSTVASVVPGRRR